MSKADFSNKTGISLTEIRETDYWIRLVIEITDTIEDRIAAKTEAEELKKIQGSFFTKLTIKSKKEHCPQQTKKSTNPINHLILDA